MSDFLAFDHLFDPVLVINFQNEVIYFNHQATVYFKLPPRLLKLKSDIAHIVDSIDFELDSWLLNAIEQKDIILTPEVKLLLPHDADIEYFAILKAVPVTIKDVQHIALFFHDTTVEKTLHLKYREQLEELKKTHNQILQADKLTTLGELTAHISHEINNPLTIAAGHSEIMKDMISMPDLQKWAGRLKTANATVIDAIERVNQIIRNMKDFLHQSEDQKEYCDLEELVNKAVEWVQNTARRANVTITSDLQAQKTVALANRIKLEQVLINLIKNSVDAIKEAQIDQGQISISISKSPHDNQTFIDVIDNGPGLSKEIKSDPFRPFQSTKEVGQGTGLGLSICAKILEAHQGKLQYIETNSGCHFRLRLPLIETYSYTRNDHSILGNKSLNKKKILVLDNEVQILNVLNSFINEDGNVFIGSSDPIDALSFLGKADVDLIITDFSMPTMNGDDFSRSARKNGYEGPILYMTSAKHIDQYNKDKSKLQIGGIIIKPFNKEDVMKTVRLALRPMEEENES